MTRTYFTAILAATRDIEGGMNRKRILLTLLAAAVGILVAKSARAEFRPALQTVHNVDLSRYSGTWYEIARYPNRFQRKCAGDTTAKYTLRPDGKVQVLNACRKSDGKLNQVKGTARVVDKRTNAKLKVTFFWPFSGDYWIIALGDEYEYAVVGEPSRKYLWILSRTSQLTPDLYDRAIAHIVAAGYDPSKLVRTPQSAATAGSGK